MKTVHKYGGSSLASMAGIVRCVDLMAADEHLQAVVVSAIGDSTTLLKKLADSKCTVNDACDQDVFNQLYHKHAEISALIGKPCQKEIDELFSYLKLWLQVPIACVEKNSAQYSDRILAFGEKLSSIMVYHCGTKRGLPIRKICAETIIATDANHGDAKPKLNLIRDNVSKIMPTSDRVIYLLEGFVGRSKYGKTTTLGRDGSDYSAALITQALQASKLYIWTDVPGIMTGDPKQVKGAKSVRRLSYLQAKKLAEFDGNILHKKTITPLESIQACLLVGSTLSANTPMTQVSGHLENTFFSIKSMSVLSRHNSQRATKFPYRLTANAESTINTDDCCGVTLIGSQLSVCNIDDFLTASLGERYRYIIASCGCGSHAHVFFRKNDFKEVCERLHDALIKQCEGATL